MNTTLTIHDAVALGTIASWCQRGARVVWLDKRGADGVAYGTARSIGDERGNFAGPADDIRDCYLRVTTATGFEMFVPMADVLERHSAGEFMEDG